MKHAYSNALKISPQNKQINKKKKKKKKKNRKVSDKNSDIFHMSSQNIDCGYSLEPLTSIHNLCFWAEIRKIMYTPVNPSFTI